MEGSHCIPASIRGCSQCAGVVHTAWQQPTRNHQDRPWLFDRHAEPFPRRMKTSATPSRADLIVAAAQIVESSAAVETIERLAREAATRGADLLLFPEMSLHGYSIGKDAIRAAATPRNGPVLAAVANIAARFRIAICVGYAEQDPATGAIYNAAALFDAMGTLAHHYRKTHLYGEYELSIFDAGGIDELGVGTLQPIWAGSRAISIGLMICMDCEYPEPARVLSLRGAQLILIPTALGVGPVARMTPDAVVPTRALENHVHIIYANYNGPATAGGYEAAYCGRSAILGPDGIELSRAPGLEAHHRGPAANETLILGDVRLAAFAADVKRNPYLSARRPELYKRLCEAAPATECHHQPQRTFTPDANVNLRSSSMDRPIDCAAASRGGASRLFWRTVVLMGVSATAGAALAAIAVSHRRR